MDNFSHSQYAQQPDVSRLSPAQQARVQLALAWASVINYCLQHSHQASAARILMRAGSPLRIVPDNTRQANKMFARATRTRRHNSESVQRSGRSASTSPFDVSP